GPLVGVVLPGRNPRLVDARPLCLAILAGTKQGHRTSIAVDPELSHRRRGSFHHGLSPTLTAWPAWSTARASPPRGLTRPRCCRACSRTTSTRLRPGAPCTRCC